MSLQFNQILLSHLPRLRAYALTLTRNSSDADDLVQTTSLLALRSESQFQIGTSFSGWSYRIMRNKYLSDCRVIKRRPVCIDDVPQESLACSDHMEERVLTREVLKAMDKLKPNLREVLTLICGGNLSYEETAKTLSCSVGTVKSRLWRARKRMKDILLGPDGDEQITMDLATSFA